MKTPIASLVPEIAARRIFADIFADMYPSPFQIEAQFRAVWLKFADEYAQSVFNGPAGLMRAAHQSARMTSADGAYLDKLIQFWCMCAAMGAATSESRRAWRAS